MPVTAERRRAHLMLGALGVVLAIALLTATCSGGGSEDGNGSDRAAANEALQAGLAAHSKGDLDAAEQDYLKTIRLDPQNKYAYYNLGVIAQTRNDAETAIANYQDVLRIDPDFVPALFNLAI